MSSLAMSEIPAALPPHKVRKLRKGTHSCQQCRRRKDKCVYDTEDPKTCAGCKARSLECRPQTTSSITGIEKRRVTSNTHGNVSAVPLEDDDLADRLSKLEQLISDMASTGTPVSTLSDEAYHIPTQLPSSSPSSLPSTSKSSRGKAFMPSPIAPDVLFPSVAHNSRAVTFSGNPSFPFGSVTVGEANSNPTHNHISSQLYALLPPESTSITLITNGPSMFLGPQSPGSQSQHIRPTDHPAIIAKQLMMLALCLQQLPSSFDTSSLVLNGNADADTADIGATIRIWVDTVATLVTSNDSLFSNVQGLETLILQAIVQGDSGHLRQAWMIGRKAISVAMLLGVHHTQPNPATFITSCIPGKTASPQLIESLWFRANCIDRYASLVLGLPPALTDSSFALERRIRHDKLEDRLSKAYAVCAGGISERNAKLASGQDAQELTHSIEVELESVSHLVDNAWWHVPDLCTTGSGLSDELMVMNLQVRHYILTVLLHLPYTLQPFEIPQNHNSPGHSRSVCMHACRAVVHRFLRFRRLCQRIITGRQIDYAALLSSMTLLQGHIVRRQQQAVGFDCSDDESLQSEDVRLVDSARQMMEEMAAGNDQDTLSSEAATSLQELLTHLRSYTEHSPDFFSFVPATETTNGEEGWQPGASAEMLDPQDSSYVGLDPTLTFPVESF